MKKLIELLNEFETEKPARDYTWRIEKQNETRLCGTEYTGAYVDDEEAERIVISKKYGFIKWLVDNDKIDRDKIIEKSDFMPIVSNKVGNLLNPTEEQELLMLLSISDTPIEDLVSYLR